MDALMFDLLPTAESLAKAIRSAFGTVGALTDRVIPSAAVPALDDLADFDEDAADAGLRQLGCCLYTFGPDGEMVVHEPGEWYLAPPTSVQPAQAAEADAAEVCHPRLPPTSAASPTCTHAAELFPQHQKPRK